MQVCIHTCGGQRWILVSYQFLSTLFILIAHDDDDEGVCVHVSGGNTCAVVRVWKSKDNSTEPVLSLHLYMGSRY